MFWNESKKLNRELEKELGKLGVGSTSEERGPRPEVHVFDEDFLNPAHAFFYDTFDLHFRDLTEIVIPETVRRHKQTLIGKRSFSVQHNRDFFFNKEKNIIIRNRYFQVLENSLNSNIPYSYKRVKGTNPKSTLSKFDII
jgi:hypothetical protein